MAAPIASPISTSMPRSIYSCMPLDWKSWWNWSVISTVLSPRPKSKSEPPATASSRHSPPVTPPAHARARSSRLRGTSPRHSRMRAIAPSSGTAHCTTTSVIETVRNLSYPGSSLKASSVNAMKLRPQASSSITAQTATIHQRLRPRTSRAPSTARKRAAAPR